MATYDIGPRVGMDGVSEFQASTKLIEANLKALGSQMQLLCAEFEGGGDSMEFYAAKSELLEKTTAATADKLAAQTRQYDEYEQELKKIEQTLANAVGRQQAAAQAVSQSQEAYKAARVELEDMKKAMDGLEELIGETADAYGEQSAEVSGLEARLAGMQQTYAAQEKTVKGLADALEDAKKEQLDSVAATTKAEKAWDAQATKMAKLDSSITKTKTEMEKLSRETEDTAQALDDMGANTTKTGQVLEKVGSAMGSAVKSMLGIKTNSADAGDAMDGARDKAMQFGDAVKAIVVGDIIKGGFEKLTGAISAVGGALKEAAGYAVDFAKKGIEVASDLDEVQNVVDVTFGEKGAAVIEDFANSAANSFGMSALAAKEYTGTMGAMLKSMQIDDSDVLTMSQDLTALAGDIASFYNLDIDEAFTKIRSGISGETEPLKQLGINMSVANMEAYALSQGITEAWQDMDQASQAALRYSYLMSVTADAQGDFARTSDSYANQQRILELNMENLSSTLGQKLLPTVTRFTSLINDLLGGNIGITEFAYSIGAELGNTINQLVAGLPDLFQAGTGIVSSLAESIVAQLPMLLPAVMELGTVIWDGIQQIGEPLLAAGGTILEWVKSGLLEKLPDLLLTGSELVANFLLSIMEGLPGALETGGQLLMTLGEGLLEKLPEWVDTGANALTEFLQVLIDGLPDVLELGWDILMTLAEGIIEKIPEMVGMLPEIVSGIARFFIEHFPEFVEMGGKVIVQLASGIVQALPEIINAAGDLIEALLTYFIYRVKGFVDIGKNVVEGIWKGISEKWTWLKNKVTGWISNIKSLFTGKDGFDEHSPSKWSEEVFENVMKGAEEGLEAGEKGLLRSAQDVVDGVRDTMTGEMTLGDIGSDLKVGMAAVQVSAKTPPVVSGGNTETGDGGADSGLVTAFREALAGAAVYMDGRKVGRLVSTSQSNTARAMGV